LPTSKTKIFGYKIFDKVTGLYLSSDGQFRKFGKVWIRRADAIKAAKKFCSTFGMNQDAILEWEILSLREDGRQLLLFDLDKMID